MRGEKFRAYLDAAEHGPGLDYGSSQDEEDVEGGLAYKKTTRGRGLGRGEEEKEGPEEYYYRPAGEAVREFERVVRAHADGGVGRDDDGPEEEQYEPRKYQDCGLLAVVCR